MRNEAALMRPFYRASFARYLEHRASRAEWRIGEEVAREIVIARTPGDTMSAHANLKTRIVPYRAAADERARELIGRFRHLQIFKQVFKTFSARVREMLGRRREVLRALAKDGEFGGEEDILFRARHALFGKRL